jgi:prevent-host-death family protein
MDSVHVNLSVMKTIPAGEFKQHCLRLLDEVRETGHGIIVTKRGTPVAQIVPLPARPENDWAGAMRGTGEILGDLVAPAAEETEWEVLGSRSNAG